MVEVFIENRVLRSLGYGVYRSNPSAIFKLYDQFPTIKFLENNVSGLELINIEKPFSITKDFYRDGLKITQKSEDSNLSLKKFNWGWVPDWKKREEIIYRQFN